MAGNIRKMYASQPFIMMPKSEKMDIFEMVLSIIFLGLTNFNYTKFM